MLFIVQSFFLLSLRGKSEPEKLLFSFSASDYNFHTHPTVYFHPPLISASSLEKNSPWPPTFIPHSLPTQFFFLNLSDFLSLVSVKQPFLSYSQQCWSQWRRGNGQSLQVPSKRVTSCHILQNPNCAHEDQAPLFALQKSLKNVYFRVFLIWLSGNKPDQYS